MLKECLENAEYTSACIQDKTKGPQYSAESLFMAYISAAKDDKR
jgi:hypothetical protein